MKKLSLSYPGKGSQRAKSPMPKASQINEALALGVTVKGVTQSPEGRIRVFCKVV